MSEQVVENKEQVGIKTLKVRTSITLTPEVLEFVKDHAESNKISVSQLIEDLILTLKPV